MGELEARIKDDAAQLDFNRNKKAVKLEVGEVSLYKFANGETKGHAIEMSGFYIVHCRDGVVWKSMLKTAATNSSMLWIHDNMLDMQTVENKQLLIPVSNIHHIEFVTEEVKKD